MDEKQCDEKLRQTFRLAAPQVDTDSFCRTSLAREAGNAEKTRHFRRAGNRGLKLGWKIAVAAVGGVVVAAAVAAAVASSRATADESPLATLDVHMTTELELRYLPDHSNWSETYVTILSPRCPMRILPPPSKKARSRECGSSKASTRMALSLCRLGP